VLHGNGRQGNGRQGNVVRRGREIAGWDFLDHRRSGDLRVVPATAGGSNEIIAGAPAFAAWATGEFLGEPFSKGQTVDLVVTDGGELLCLGFTRMLLGGLWDAGAAGVVQ
jgi:hypothetical protein